MNLMHDAVRTHKILVVDDVEGNRTVVCRRLEATGYDLHAVDSGEKALDFVRTEKPDLILLDYMMPGMNGVEVLNVLRRDWHIEDLPVIMLTARAEAEAVVAALEAGADDYIAKPIDFDVLKARIETQLNKQKTSDTLRQANAALDERVTMRVLAFDQLREELEREIMGRRNAERALADLQAKMGEEPSAQMADVGHGLEKAMQITESISRAAASGQPINQALLTALKSILSSVRSKF
nr:response regulator [uncultured Sphingomonas sp.]